VVVMGFLLYVCMHTVYIKARITCCGEKRKWAAHHDHGDHSCSSARLDSSKSWLGDGR